MRAKVSSSVLSMLLVATLLGGNCALCPPLDQQTSPQHDCCKPATQSHCNPTPEDSGKKECPKHSLAAENYQKAKAESASALELAPAVYAASTPAASAPAKAAVRKAGVTFEASPPQLYLLHSVLRI